MRYILLSVLLILGLTIITKRGDDRRLKSLKNETVLAFGDSLTYGYGTCDPSQESYPAILARMTGRRIINAGVNGETTAEGLRRIDPILQKYQPGLTILCLGGNDILQGIPRQQIQANLATIIEKILVSGSALLLVALPDFSLLGLETLPLYRKLAEKYHLPLEEDALSEILDNRRLKSDTIHPNAEGYKKLAEKIYEKLRDERLFDNEQP